jgi:ferrochelatase
MIDGVVLLGFGGPTSPDEIRPFLDRVLHGRPVPPPRYEAIVEHYMHIGGRSPYNDLSRRQASALADELKARGVNARVHLGFRNAAPLIADVFADLASAGARELFAIPLTAYGGSASAQRYVDAASDALKMLGERAPSVRYAAPFYDRRLFIQAHASRIRQALRQRGARDLSEIELVFTAHSVPLSAATPYGQEIEMAARRIAEVAAAPSWTLAYQSRSGSPSEPWLEPDVRDTLRSLAKRGVRDALLAPVGFLCEHVEVLYDLDVDAAAVAGECAIAMTRAQALDDHPLFIEMLAELVEEAISATTA